jgi:hypothetical protein
MATSRDQRRGNCILKRRGNLLVRGFLKRSGNLFVVFMSLRIVATQTGWFCRECGYYACRLYALMEG